MQCVGQSEGRQDILECRQLAVILMHILLCTALSALSMAHLQAVHVQGGCRAIVVVVPSVCDLWQQVLRVHGQDLSVDIDLAVVGRQVLQQVSIRSMSVSSCTPYKQDIGIPQAVTRG